MPSQDYFLDGAWDFHCMECDRKLKSVDALFRWDGLWVGPECFELRNPQDYVRGIPDDPSTPWSTGGNPQMALDVPADTTGIGCVANNPQLRLRPIGFWMFASQLIG